MLVMCTHLYAFKYSYLIQTICKLYGFNYSLGQSLQRGKIPPNECPVFDTKSFDCEVSILKVWRICVIYWPSTEPSIKICTCVNIRKNSGSWWALENNITRCPGWFETVGDRMPKWEPACRLRALWPSVTDDWATPAKMRKQCCYGRGRTWVNIAVRPCLHSFLTYNKHHPFENKVWGIYIFIKKCIRSLLKSSLPVNDVSVCKCIFVNEHVLLYCGYTTYGGPIHYYYKVHSDWKW